RRLIDMGRSVVAVSRGAGRYETVKKTLELIRDDIAESIKGKRKILIKPNFVSDSIQLAATHVDAVRAILDTITPLTSGEILIGEGSYGDTFKGYRNFGYMKLRSEYSVELVDLNSDEYVEVNVFNGKFREFPVRVSRIVYESDYRISAAVMKTHDFVVATLSIKNMAVGSIIKPYKGRIHQGYPAINLNIYRIAKFIPVHLAVIDAFKAMEGDGPVWGSEVSMNAALAGLDPVAVDAVAAYIMGFNPMDIGYIYYCHKFGLGNANIENIRIVGENIETLKRGFKPHRTIDKQFNWRIPQELLSQLNLNP
ncbi:DUF362 domain-containing protein, partial [Candidatus Bathyarchaeota archaeon]|nr:DUF362 domain-containing protein [Candidatus Bathyarchaeota archaeon]